MSPEAQRIAIAEACGWKSQRWGSKPHEISWITPQQTYGECPDYLNDLNAMHEAELHCLNFNDQESDDIFKYLCALTTICGHDITFVLHATAKQRAEALLKTIGRWDDSK